ncbi:MAG: hypothetical protein AAB308_03240 [Nitrospirota bacterium]
MILPLTISSALSADPMSSQGQSDLAEFLHTTTKAEVRRLHDSHELGLRGKGVLTELCRVYQDCRTPNWDGYGALPVSHTTYLTAEAFLDSLPLGTPAPTIGAEADGHLTIEWYQSPQEQLSISISSDNNLHYAGIHGISKFYGTEAFFGDSPTSLLQLIYKVSSPLLA